MGKHKTIKNTITIWEHKNVFLDSENGEKENMDVQTLTARVIELEKNSL